MYIRIIVHTCKTLEGSLWISFSFPFFSFTYKNATLFFTLFPVFKVLQKNSENNTAKIENNVIIPKRKGSSKQKSMMR